MIMAMMSVSAVNRIIGFMFPAAWSDVSSEDGCCMEWLIVITLYQ